MISYRNFRRLQHVFGHPIFVEVADALCEAWMLTERFSRRMSLDDWVASLTEDDLLNMRSDMIIFRSEAAMYWAEMLDSPSPDPIGTVDWVHEGF